MWLSGSPHCVASVSRDGRPSSDPSLVERVSPIMCQNIPYSQSMLLACLPFRANSVSLYGVGPSKERTLERADGLLEDACFKLRGSLAPNKNTVRSGVMVSAIRIHVELGPGPSQWDAFPHFVAGFALHRRYAATSEARLIKGFLFSCRLQQVLP